MISSPSLVKRPLQRRELTTRLLIAGFWLLAFTLALHFLLVVLPAYGGGLVPPYLAGWRLKDLQFDVPVYSSFFWLQGLLFFPVLLLIAFVTWLAPALSLAWALLLARSWRRLPRRTVLGWLVVLLPLWAATLLTRTAAAAFLVWLLD